MRVFERAWLYLSRNKARFGILFTLFLVICTLVTLCVSVGNAAKTSLDSLRERLGGYFQVKSSPDQGYFEFVSDTMVQDILAAGGIKAYNGMDTRYFYAEGIELEPGRFTGEGDKKARLARVLGNTDTSLSEYFLLRYYELEEGRHISPDDRNKALISAELAERNGLSVGDRISLRIDEEKLDEEQKKQVKSHTAEVAGIYGIETAMGAVSGDLAECDLEYNFIFTDTAFIREFYEDLGAGTQVYLDGVSFFVKDPRELDRIAGSLADIGNYNWDGYEVVKNNKAYEASAVPLERLSGVVSVMVFAIAIISAIMLSLILFLWMRERVHEIGVYLSLGKTWREILGQHILENLLVAAMAFFIACGICRIASETVEQAVRTAFFEEAGEEAEAKLPQLVEMGITELAEVAAIGSLIVVLSTAVSSAAVLRMRPKDVLSLMS